MSRSHLAILAPVLLFLSVAGCSSAHSRSEPSTSSSTQAPAPTTTLRSSHKATPAHHGVIASPKHASRPSEDLTLLTEPADGYTPIDQLIAYARHTVDLTIYELDDQQIEEELASAQHRGVRVRVLLDSAYSGASVNGAASSTLQQAGVSVRWAPEEVIFHQKTLTVDGETSAIMTGNLTPEDYPTTRDFIVIDRNRSAVSAIKTVFDDDWRGNSVTAGPAIDGLLWSPGAEPELLSLIDSAHQSLMVENEEMDSTGVESALEAAAQRGVRVDVVMTKDAEWTSALNELSDAGVHVATYPDISEALYVHAKTIVVDDTTAFIGSQNFSTSSLDYNRELGVITTDPVVVHAAAHTLAADFSGATAW